MGHSRKHVTTEPRETLREIIEMHTHTRGGQKQEENQLGGKSGEERGTTTEQDTPRGRQGTASEAATMMKTSSCKKHQRTNEKT